MPGPPSGHLLHPGTEQRFPALQADSLPAELPGKPSGEDQAPDEDCGTGQACPHVPFSVPFLSWESFPLLQYSHAFLGVNKGDRVATEAWGVLEATLGCCAQGGSLSGREI